MQQKHTFHIQTVYITRMLSHDQKYNVYAQNEEEALPDIAEGSERVFCHDVTDRTPERVEAVQLPVCLLTGKLRLAIGFDEGLGSCHAKWVRERAACCFVSQ